MKAYDALTLPLGASVTLPIHFQNEHALRFAINIEGLEVGVLRSHPRVVSVQLDHYNQTMTLESLGSGDCNIVLFLGERQHIFDVIRVKVASVVRPQSPVLLHVGGEVDFKVDSAEDQMSRYPSDPPSGSGGSAIRWGSSDAYVLDIDARTGKAVGLAEGKAEVTLSQHSNTASIVHVSKVRAAQYDPASSTLINTDAETNLVGNAPGVRVRVKFFLGKQSEEQMPTERGADGITLVRQNIGIKCESDKPEFVVARGEVSDTEGYFCVVNYRPQGEIKGMPRFVKIFVYATGARYTSERLTDFDVQLTSEIKVETRYRTIGVHLDRNLRSVTMKVLSSDDIRVSFEYYVPEEAQLIIP